MIYTDRFRLPAGEWGPASLGLARRFGPERAVVVHPARARIGTARNMMPLRPVTARINRTCRARTIQPGNSECEFIRK